MDSNYKFFVHFLNKEGVRRTFFNNMKAQGKSPDMHALIMKNDEIKHRGKGKSYSHIDYGLRWADTPEGSSYWSDMNKRFVGFLNKVKQLNSVRHG